MKILKKNIWILHFFFRIFGVWNGLDLHSSWQTPHSFLTDSTYTPCICDEYESSEAVVKTSMIKQFEPNEDYSMYSEDFNVWSNSLNQNEDYFIYDLYVWSSNSFEASDLSIPKPSTPLHWQM